MILIHSHSFLPQNPKSHFPFFLISISTETRRRESSRAERDTKQQGVAFFFSLLQYCLTLSLSLWFCLHIVQLFFLVFFWYNFLLFDSFLFFWWWWCCSYYSLKAKLEVLDSLLQGTELLFNFLSFMPSCLPSPLFDLFF